MPVLYSYVVAYDSGFAPNPFHGYCTLATCKPRIRQHASNGDWIIGTGSDRKCIRYGGHLVFAIRVQESLTFSEYWDDPRFQRKKPNLYGSYRMACGDNIYRPDPVHGGWQQLNSYHSKENGSPNHKHISRDTSVNRVLISADFVYFGAEGPLIPGALRQAGIVHKGRNYRKVTDERTIVDFEEWLASLELRGYQGEPYDMLNGIG